jgi:hypothetical protein
LVLALHRSDVLDQRALRHVGARLETLVAEAERTLAAVPSVAAGSELVFSSALRDVFAPVFDRHVARSPMTTQDLLSGLVLHLSGRPYRRAPTIPVRHDAQPLDPGTEFRMRESARYVAWVVRLRGLSVERRGQGPQHCSPLPSRNSASRA